MADMGAAEKRLERAIARLETALQSSASVSPSATTPTATPIAESENNGVREEIRDVTVRLDSAIHRLRRALGE
ncbi:MAG: hypothetical protein J4G10_04570 [Alphaproteobacteria bacterium]|nr:hypothetical protein [Alphaproteobacteria bacterium]